VRFLTDTNGTMTDSYQYDAYGTLIGGAQSTANEYLYSGQQYDADLGLYYCRARYLNTDTGRFWTKDSYEGDNEDPLSLHKYLYAQGNPVMVDDPSGQDGELAGTLASVNIGIRIAAFSGAVLLEAKTHAIGNLTQAVATEAITEGSSLVEVAKSALQAAGKSVRQLIQDARNKLGQLRSKINVIPIPQSVIPNVAKHIANAQSLGYPGLPMPLTRCAPIQAKINRADAVRGLGSAFPNSWDEYPFASSVQGGSWTSVSPVPLWENCVQGGIISACYTIEKIKPGNDYFVVVIP